MARNFSPLPTQDPGLGEKFTRPTQRQLNRDGSFNVQRAGRERTSADPYFLLVNRSWRGFFGWVLGWFVSINTVFALGYLLIGYDKLVGAPPAEHWFQQYLYAFFFSVQTFNTVGYGVMSPHGIAANLLTSFEALTGVLTYSIIAGSLYARFSRPRARILFSDVAVITAPNATTGRRRFMFRIANKRSNVLIDLQARVMLSVMRPDFTRRYYALALERSNVTFFPLNWTLVHEIDDESPLAEVTPEELASSAAEILVQLRGYDDTYAQDVHARSSYRFDELRWNNRFVQPYRITDNGETILDLDLLHATEEDLRM